jgi:hypothetical protein
VGLKTLVQMLFGLTRNCGTVPLLGTVLLLGWARFGSWVVPPVEAAVERPRLEYVHPDQQIIDAVLTRRAPGLGLTLRQQLGHAIAEEATRAGYDPLLILAIIDVESDFQEEAVSNKGARGLMQIQPTTLHFVAQKHGLKLSREEVASDQALNVRLGIRYLRDLQDRFGGDLDLALMAYNGGPTKIRAALKEKGGLEPFRRYPQLVRRDFRRFREGVGLGGDWALAQRALDETETAAR